MLVQSKVGINYLLHAATRHRVKIFVQHVITTTNLYVGRVGFREGAAQRDHLLGAEGPVGEAKARAAPPPFRCLHLHIFVGKLKTHFKQDVRERYSSIRLISEVYTYSINITCCCTKQQLNKHRLYFEVSYE